MAKKAKAAAPIAATKQADEPKQQAVELIECDYCGGKVASNKAVEAHGKKFCSEAHAATYADTMKKLDHTF